MADLHASYTFREHYTLLVYRPLTATEQAAVDALLAAKPNELPPAEHMSVIEELILAEDLQVGLFALKVTEVTP